MRSTSVMLAGVVMMAACARTAPQLAPASDADVAAVARIVASLDSCAQSGAPDDVMSRLTDDIVLLGSDQPAIVGKAAVREFYQGLCGTMRFDVHHAPIETHAVGNLVVARVEAGGTATPRAGGPAMPVNNKYLMLFRRQADGSLRVWRVAANTNAPPVPPPAATPRR